MDSLYFSNIAQAKAKAGQALGKQEDRMEFQSSSVSNNTIMKRFFTKMGASEFAKTLTFNFDFGLTENLMQ